jgi:Tfp pilus assembly protein PilO
VILAAVAAFVVCVLFFVLFIRPKQSELSRVNDEIATAQNENQSLSLELDRLKQLQENAPELNATLEQIRGFVPKEAEVPNFIFQVQEAANLADVGFVQITPELPDAPPEGAPLAEIRVIINAQGGYFSIQDFVRRLYSLDRALRIDTVEMGTEISTETQGAGGTTTSGTAGLEEGELDLSITARIFFELPEGGAAPAPGTTPAPGATPAPGTSPAPAGSPAPTDTAAPAPAPTS